MNVGTLRVGVLVAVALGLCPADAPAADVDHAIGLTYTSGGSDVFDFFDDQPFIDTFFAIPIGLSYRPVIAFDTGLRVDISVGPLVVVLVEEIFTDDIELEYFDLGLSGTVGWDFSESSAANFYLRAGVAGHIIDTDFSADSSAFGFLAAAGVEFAKQSRVNGFIELAYDSSEITMSSVVTGPRDVNPLGYMLTGGVVLAF